VADTNIMTVIHRFMRMCFNAHSNVLTISLRSRVYGGRPRAQKI
jgi:hypothetical protein